MRITLLIAVLMMTALPVSADGLWSFYERVTPASSWQNLDINTIKIEKWAREFVRHRCIASAAGSPTAKAVIKIVSPGGAEQVFVCSEVRAANGDPDRGPTYKEGQIKIDW